MARSDYQDIVESIGFSTNQDVGYDVVGNWVVKTELEGVQAELLENYELSYDLDQIQELMDEFGITFGYEREYSIADIIAEELEIQHGNA